MNNNYLYDLIIIGGGPVGLYACFYAGLRKMKVKVIESLPYFGGQIMTLYKNRFIYDFPGIPKILGEQTVEGLIKQTKQFNPSIVLGETVELLKKSKNEKGELFFELGTQKSKHYSKSILISIGGGQFSPRKFISPEISTLEEKNLLFYFIEDFEKFKNKKLAIFGGGETAISWAYELKDYVKSLYLIHRSDVFRGGESKLEELDGLSHIKIITYGKFKKVLLNHESSSIEKLIISQNDKDYELDVDYINLSLGFQPNLGYLRSWDINKIFNDDFKIEVSRTMQSLEDPFIWAAGDIVDYPGKLKLLSVGFSEAVTAINSIKTTLYPQTRFFPGHSSHLKKGTFLV